MNRHLTDINEFLQYFYVIIDNITGETLISARNNEWGWGGYYERLSLSDIDEESAVFSLFEHAEIIVSRLIEDFLKNEDEVDFSIVKFYYGSELYEDIKSALNTEYGDTLWEYGTDHKLTAAIMRVLNKHNYDL